MTIYPSQSVYTHMYYVPRSLLLTFHLNTHSVNICHSENGWMNISDNFFLKVFYQYWKNSVVHDQKYTSKHLHIYLLLLIIKLSKTIFCTSTLNGIGIHLLIWMNKGLNNIRMGKFNPEKKKRIQWKKYHWNKARRICRIGKIKGLHLAETFSLKSRYGLNEYFLWNNDPSADKKD